jgi:tetratricopeptide (TPR) repeat protein
LWEARIKAIQEKRYKEFCIETGNNKIIAWLKEMETAGRIRLQESIIAPCSACQLWFKATFLLPRATSLPPNCSASPLAQFGSRFSVLGCKRAPATRHRAPTIPPRRWCFLVPQCPSAPEVMGYRLSVIAENLSPITEHRDTGASPLESKTRVLQIIKSLRPDFGGRQAISIEEFERHLQKHIQRLGLEYERIEMGNVSIIRWRLQKVISRFKEMKLFSVMVQVVMLFTFFIAPRIVLLGDEKGKKMRFELRMPSATSWMLPFAISGILLYHGFPPGHLLLMALLSLSIGGFVVNALIPSALKRILVGHELLHLYTILICIELKRKQVVEGEIDELYYRLFSGAHKRIEVFAHARIGAGYLQNLEEQIFEGIMSEVAHNDNCNHVGERSASRPKETPSSPISTKNGSEGPLAHYSLIRYPSSSRIINFLSICSGLSLWRRSFKALIIIGVLGGWILMRIIPEYALGGYANMSAKCWSWVSIILFVSLAICAISLSLEPDGTSKMSCPSFFRRSTTSLRTFSSIRSRILRYFSKRNVFAGFDYFSGIMKRGLDMPFGKLRVSLFNNFFGILTSFKHFKDEIHKYSRPFETCLTMAYVWVNRDIFVKIIHFLTPNIYSKQDISYLYLKVNQYIAPSFALGSGSTSPLAPLVCRLASLPVSGSIGRLGFGDSGIRGLGTQSSINPISESQFPNHPIALTCASPLLGCLARIESREDKLASSDTGGANVCGHRASNTYGVADASRKSGIYYWRMNYSYTHTNPRIRGPPLSDASSPIFFTKVLQKIKSFVIYLLMAGMLFMQEGCAIPLRQQITIISPFSSPKEKFMAAYHVSIKSATKYIERYPCAGSYYSRGLLYAHINKFEEAKQDFAKAIELDPQYSLHLLVHGLIISQDVKIGSFAVNTFLNAVKDPRYYVLRHEAAEIFGKTDTFINFAILRLKDPSWQVRETAVLFLDKSDMAEAVEALIPLLKDNDVRVCEVTALSLGRRVKSYPELAKDFINILKTDSNPNMKYIAAKSLQGVNTPEVKEAKPLIQKTTAEVKVVVIIPGVDDKLLGLDPFSSRKVEWSKNIQLRKLLELAGIRVLEHCWTGNLVGKDFQDAKLELDTTMLKALKMAGEHDKVIVMMYSGGNLVGERFFASDLDPLIKEAFKEKRINLLSLGSPSRQNFASLDPNWKNMALDKDLVYRIFGLKQFKVEQHDVVYPYPQDISKRPIDAHSTFQDYRVISDIIHKVFPKLQIPQLDKMLKEQDVSKWKYFPTRGSWPGIYNFESVSPRPYVDYGAGHLRDPFVPQLPSIPPQQPILMPGQQPIHTPQPIYTPERGSWPGQYNFNIRAPDNYYRQQQQIIIPPPPIILPSIPRLRR